MKRLFDIIVAIFVLVLLSPVLLLIAILIKYKMGGPIFFLQTRPGLNGKPFTLVKFRTMKNTMDTNNNLTEDANRITRLGSLLRATSLDEIPSFWCVLKNDMSIIGPRPLLMEYLPLYSEYQDRRHEVRPGITGWAQVNGRNTISWEEKFIFDVWYVDNKSLLLDLRILLLTIKKVYLREGISAHNEATMSEFLGSPEADKYH